MPTIYLGKGNQYSTEVSDEDYQYLMQWKWNYKISRCKNGRKVYARRGGGRFADGRIRPTILMHNVVLERARGPKPSDVHTGDHGDRDSLNNRRENLNWATPSEQGKNRDCSTTFKPRAVPNGLDAVIPF